VHIHVLGVKFEFLQKEIEHFRLHSSIDFQPYGIAEASTSQLHFDGFQKGVLDSRDLLYFLSVIFFSLFATGVIIRDRRAG